MKCNDGNWGPLLDGFSHWQAGVWWLTWRCSRTSAAGSRKLMPRYPWQFVRRITASLRNWTWLERPGFVRVGRSGTVAWRVCQLGGPGPARGNWQSIIVQVVCQLLLGLTRQDAIWKVDRGCAVQHTNFWALQHNKNICILQPCHGWCYTSITYVI